MPDKAKSEPARALDEHRAIKINVDFFPLAVALVFCFLVLDGQCGTGRFYYQRLLEQAQYYDMLEKSDLVDERIRLVFEEGDGITIVEQEE